MSSYFRNKPSKPKLSIPTAETLQQAFVNYP